MRDKKPTEKKEAPSLSSKDLEERIQKLHSDRSLLRDKLDAARASVNQLDSALLGTEHRIAELSRLRDELNEKDKAARKKAKKDK
jgi:hypothetical protein